MDVVVNAISARRGGGVRHLTPFLNGMLGCLPDSRITAFIQAGLDTSAFDQQISIEAITIPVGLNRRRVLWDQWQFPRRAKGSDVAISPLNVGPIRITTPHILFERNALYFDREYLKHCSPKRRASLIAHRVLVLGCIRGADKVVVPSNAMANMIEEWVSLGDRLVVIPHGYSHEEVVGQSPTTVPDAWLRWRSQEVRLLHVGDGGHHKDLPFLADILAGVSRTLGNVGLAVTVTIGDGSRGVSELLRRASELGVFDQIYFLGTIPQHSISVLYRDANVFLFPSLTESFGFPLLEAIAAGTSIVATDIPATREVARGFATYFPQNDVPAAIGAVLARLSQPALPDDLERSAHLNTYSWARHCRGVADLVKEVAS